MERMAAVAQRGQRQWDVEGGRHISVGGQHIKVGGTYRGGGEHADGVGPWVCDGGARNPLAALGQPKGTGVGQVATQASSGTESVTAAVRRVARCDRSQTSGRG